MKKRRPKKPRVKTASAEVQDHMALAPQSVEAEPGDMLDRQTAFALSYIRNGFNATRAARDAGYSGDENTLAAQGYENLRKPKVVEVLRRVRAEFVMDAIEALHRLAGMARSNVDDFLSPGGRIDVLKARENGMLWLVKKIKQKEYMDGGGDNAERVLETSVELYDAQAALKLFLQFHGLLDRATRGSPKEEAAVHEALADNILRVHGREKGIEIVKALGLKVARGVH